MNLVEKYRPKTLDELVVDDGIRELIRSYLNKGTICNLLLVGRAGLGKTSLAKIIASELNATTLYVNCGEASGVDNIRCKVKEFCDAISLDNSIKVVILDEADALSSNAGTGASAQGALRNLIEEAQDDTRFILTGNYINKIIEPIQSRCTPIKLRFTTKDVLARVIHILKSEKIKYDNDTVKVFFEQVIKKRYPDIRSIINNLEHWVIDGKLTVGTVSDEATVSLVVDRVKLCLEKKTTPLQLREYLLQNEGLFENDYELLAGEVFNNIEDYNQQIVIAEYLYRMGLVIDKEIQFYSMVLQLVK